MHYVVGDVHGCYNEMQDLINIIEGKDNEAIIIFVGDFIDRGEHTFEVLEWAQSHIVKNSRYKAVRGNHEQEVIDWYENKWKTWYMVTENGGSMGMPETRYDFSCVMKENGLLKYDKLQNIVDFFKSLPLQMDIKIHTAHGYVLDYHIVHAWVNFMSNMTVDEERRINLWERNYDGNHINESIIVHGHTPTVERNYISSGYSTPGMISYGKNAINVDCGCIYKKDVPWFPCMLGAICLETLEEIYPYTLKERFKQLNMNKSEKEIKKMYSNYYYKYLVRENLYRKAMLYKIQR